MADTEFTMADLAVICPTKDRPDKLARLLDNLSQLPEKPFQVLVADGGDGENLKPVVKKFAKELNIHHLLCPEQGQVLQRNYAHGYLHPTIKLVAHVDDDITFEVNAYQNILKFWNERAALTELPIGGVSFNLVDLKPIAASFLRKLFFMAPEPVGTVSRSGYARPFLPAGRNLKVDWLLGGATVWSRDVIRDNPHPLSIKTRWAVCEDLMYSYPLRHTHLMLACCDADAYHNENYNENNLKVSVFHGVSSTVMRYHFVRCNVELSTPAFVWMTIGIICGHLGVAVQGNKRALGLSLGMIEGLIRIFVSALSGCSSFDLARQLCVMRA